MTVLDRFVAAVARAPEAIAVEGSAATSYAELAHNAAARSRALADRGIGVESRVALCLRPSLELVELMLGVMATGAAFIPLDADSPPARIAAMLRAARPDLIVAPGALLGWAPFADHERAAVETLHGEPTGSGVAVPRDAAAYVVFTSGSTGTPKGVVVTHSGLASMIDQQIAAFGITPESRVLQFASPSFDASVSEVFTALGAGATLCLIEHARDRQGLALIDQLARRRITVATLPPSLLRALPDRALPELATLVSAGEACSAEVVARWAAGRTLINAYGPSETTVCATMQVLAPGSDAMQIGPPLAGLRAYVLDETLAPTTTGELYLAGAGVARGYVAQPGLTAERFVPDPWVPGARMYRTGDRVTRHGDRLAYHGRLDDQVKVRGFRIEPGEVEAVLRGAAGVGDALVQIRRRATGDAVLVACIVGDPAIEPALRVFARRALPEYMQPAEYGFVAAWPRLPSGKVDRAALPLARPHAPSVASTGPAAELRALCASLLELPGVGPDDNFFELGGDSILALRLLARLEAQTGRRVALSTLFERPTPAGLAGWLAAERTEEPAPLVLRGGDRAQPLWLIPPVHGNALCYLELARRMAAGPACLGLQLPGVDDDRAPIDDLAELARYLVAIVRRAQPTGPYRLIGWSLGGSIAYQMAVELQRAGHEVPVLALIASTPPTEVHLAVARQVMDGYPLWKMCHMYGANATITTGGRVDLAAHFRQFEGLDDARAVALLASQLGAHGPFSADVSATEIGRWVQVFRASLRAFHHCDARARYRGRALSILSAHANPFHKSPLVDRPLPPGDWREHVEALEVVKVPGDHLNLMGRPWVDGVVDALERWLAQSAG